MGQPGPASTILYNNYDFSTGQPLVQLSVVNADGTGNVRIPVNLLEPGYPAISLDGKLVALTAADPKKAFTLSRDVFLLNLATAQLSQLTSFPNIWDSNETNAGGIAITGGGYTLPWFKAFSPDAQHLAISADVVSEASLTLTNSVESLFGYDVTGSSVTLPTLWIYSLDGTTPPITVAQAGDAADIHAGDGVDWAPNGNLLVWPKDTTVIYGGVYGGSPGPVTALYIMNPVSDAINTGQARQVTFPQGQGGILSDFSGTYIAWETDYAPAFSPDSQRIAYVRADSVKSSTSLGYVSQDSLRIVGVDGANDSAVMQFNVGQYVTHVTWSPDGTQLVFDLGQQIVGPGGLPYLLADPSTDALYVMNVDGTGLRQLRPPPSTWPVWTAALASATSNPPAPALDILMSPNRNTITLSWPSNSGNWVLQTTPQLGPQAAWQMVPGQAVLAGGQNQLRIAAPAKTQFYRLMQP